MERNRVRRAAWLGAMAALLLLVTSIRVWNLESVPPGLTHDEAANGHDSAAILRGVHRIYFPVGYGREPLYNYSAALVTAALGQGIFTLRLTSVAWSLATWLCTTCLARRWWGRRAALLTGAALAVGFWPLMMARVGLRAPTLPALLAASALAYEHALSQRHGRWGTRTAYALAGLFLGAGFYTYMASRGMPLLYLGFVAVLWLTDRTTARRITPYTLGLLVVAGLVGLPLFAYLRAHPGLEQRIGQLAGALRAFGGGDWRPLWHSIWGSLPMYLWRADPYWLYNVAGRAALEPFLAGAWALGCLTALLRLRDRRAAFVLLWLAVGTAPALLTEVVHNSFRAIAALPAAFLLAGMGMDQLLTWAAKLRPRWLPALSAAAVALGLIWSGADALHSYFVQWREQRNVRVAYHHAIVTLAASLDGESAADVVISTMYPGEFHDPYVAEVTMRQESAALHWVDGRAALALPREPGLLVVDPQAPLAPALAEAIAPSAQPQAPLTFRPDDMPPRLDIYCWNPESVWQALVAHAQTRVGAAIGDPPPGAALLNLESGADFAGVIALKGYRPIVTRGSDGTAVVELVTLWEVGAPYPDELVLFAHLLAADGTLLAQSDRLDAPNWQWQVGDRFAQLHTLAPSGDAAAEPAAVALGFYRRADAIRLDLTGAAAGATRVIVPLTIE